MKSHLQDLLDEFYLINRCNLVSIICQTMLYGHSCNFSYMVRTDYWPSLYLRHISVSRSNRGSRHGVRDPSPIHLILLFSQGILIMEQRKWASKSSSEMATRHHYFHVRVIDCGFGPFYRPLHYKHELVEPHRHGVLR